MSGIGFWELIILFLIGLVVLGPERLPRVANQLGSWLGQARRMTRVMRRQLEEELDLDKKLNIRPPPPIKPRNDEDDSYSPAHDPKSVGTGVGDGELTDDAEAVPDEPDEPDAAATDDVVKETM
jgi:sec-independent protein translocase protein TatB